MSTWNIVNGDCMELIDKYIDEFTVIVTDPPFNIGYHYKGYKDRIKNDIYLDMVGGVLKKAPSVLIHYPEDIVKVSMQMSVAPTRIISWVYNSNTKRQHRDIAFYGIEPRFSEVKQPYKNPNDKRIKELIAKGSKGTNVYDWWNINQVKNVSKEKTPHPCQMPLEVMDRIIKLLPEGVSVLDPFCGSGTTGVACLRNNVNFIGIEIVEEYANIARDRLSAEPTVPQKEYTEQQIRDTFNSGYSCGMQNEWITDEPPVDGQEVIATVYWTDYGDTITAYGHYNARFDTWSLYSDVEGGLNKGFEVIAWMPLPEPYKGGDDK